MRRARSPMPPYPAGVAAYVSRASAEVALTKLWITTHQMAQRAELAHEWLYDAALTGLRRALGAYDPAHGVRFWTFAEPCIRSAIRDAVQRQQAEQSLPRLSSPGEPRSLDGDPAPHVERRHAAQVTIARAQACFTPWQAQVVRGYLHGLRPTEIAREAGVTVANVAQACRVIQHHPQAPYVFAPVRGEAQASSPRT